VNVCVQGLWHLGSVTSACLASLEHKVVGLDFDADLIDRLKRGSAPLFEPGLDAMILEGISGGMLEFIHDPRRIPSNTDVFWIAYDTPVDENDNADVDHVFSQIKRAISYIPHGATLVVSSQLPIGSVKRLERFVEQHLPDKDFGFTCFPENLRLGKAVDAFLRPDRIVVGYRAERDRVKLQRLLETISHHIEWMSVESAELTKHAINAFLATSIVFANEIACICECVGADAKEVERGLKTEHRIGPKAYLSPGAAFAGGTLARDITFLNAISKGNNVITPLLSSVKTSNDAHRLWVRRKLQALFPELTNIGVAIWGLTYKAGTDTLRRSTSLELCEWLVAKGANVRVHDPMARLPEPLKTRITQYEQPLDALKGAHVLIICTEWPQYKDLSPNIIADVAERITVLDPNRFLRGLAENKGVKYISVGSPA